MSYVGLTDLLLLPNICCNAADTHHAVHLTDGMHNDPLEMLHLRCGQVDPHCLRVIGICYYGGTSARCLSSQCLVMHLSHCQGNDHTAFIPSNQPRYLAGQQVPREGHCFTANFTVYLICPSYRGYNYVFDITDVATKMLWEFSLKNRRGSLDHR